jgi:hypothetical protein
MNGVGWSGRIRERMTWAPGTGTAQVAAVFFFYFFLFPFSFYSYSFLSFAKILQYKPNFFQKFSKRLHIILSQ